MWFFADYDTDDSPCYVSDVVQAIKQQTRRATPDSKA
jgi:hypothetical protein